MMGGSETGSRDKDGVHAAAIHVPIGWQRRVEGVQVVYVSPNGTALSSLDEVKTYLLSDGTCKCGLECPLIIHKVFNFTVGVKVEQHNQPLSKAEQDMTKLCNHRRKVVAMAALCRSMQASQLPFANVHHPEPGIVVDSCNPKRTHIKGEEEGRGICLSKPLPKPSRTQNNLHPNPVASPKSPQQFVYPYNGASPGIHTDTSAHHPLEALKRLQHPPFSLPSSSSSSSSLPAHCFSQRSQRNPTPQNVTQCHRASKTPEVPSSPRSRLHASPPPVPTGSGGTGQPAAAHHPRGVIIGGSPSSLSPSLSPSVHNVNCASPHQRSRHPSSSPSPLSDQGSTPVMAGDGLLASNLRHRRKSTSSSPQPPLSCSSNPNSHFPKYKLEEVLEQFKNNISTSNHLLIPTNTFLTNQSSANPHALSLKTLKSTVSPIPSTGLHSFVSTSAAGCSSPFQNHHGHQSKPPHPASFPASSLLSAAAKAQLAHQLNQVQGSNVANNQESTSTSAEELKETQQQQSTKVHSDAGVDTLIPLSIQSKDNPILQQFLPTLLNPALLGDPSGITGLHNIMGIGAGSILLPPNPALGMPLLQGPDGAINLLNNIQLNLSPPSEAEKSATLQETPSPTPHEDIPAMELSSEAHPSPASTPKHTPSPQQAPGGRTVIDPYTSFMDTIYTSFLQVNAKEEEDGGDTGPSDPTSPFCALPPVPFPFKNHAPSTPASVMPQASAPVSLSPRLACSLRNPDLSRLSLEAAAHSPAQGTPKPSEEGAITPLQRKQVIEEGHTHPDPPLPPIFFEEAKTDYAGPASAVCPYVAGADRQGHPPQSGYLQPRDSCSGMPTQEMSEILLHREQERDDAGAVGGARRGRKRKQTLQNVLEDFRDLDAATLEETKATTALLKPERSVRGRRRRGARSQRQ
ncbi:uncharacterized protein mbd6 isoform 2-T4 [Synchiropus picturatus]